MLSLQFLLYAERTPAEFRLRSKLGGNSAGASSEKRGSRRGHVFFPPNIKKREVSSKTQLEGKQKVNIGGRILEMLGDSAIKNSLSLRTLLLRPRIWVFIIAFILWFCLPQLPGASVHISAAAAFQMCSMRGDFKHFSTRQKCNYLKDKMGGKLYSRSCWWILNHRNEILYFWPSRTASPLLLPELVRDITACIRVLFPFVKACHDSMSGEVEEYALKADTLFWILFLMN